MANRLAGETSPYLLQHAHNPVDWHPWGPEALERARREDKPILLSIGYAACHWCHVMERESFESDATAELMNRHFVNIKVDREERPDLDEIYMAATVAMSGSGGWPMTVFLTPDTHEPFFAGTYFPPRDMYGRPGFPTLLRRIADLWRGEREGLMTQARELTEHLEEQARAALPASIGQGAIDAAVGQLRRQFDPRWGGFGNAPKFPPSMALELLLRHHRRAGGDDSLVMLRGTLDGMAGGGMRDHLGGGFARYSTDERWLVPHFEKMLYDNALLARVYAWAWQVTRHEPYREVASETLDYVLREMTSPDGGFYSATDADSEGEEGKFFVWTPAEVEGVLPADQARAFCAFYDVTEEGNWEGKSIIHTPRSRAEVARELGMSPEELTALLNEAKPKMYAARKERVPPLLDDKILTSWNGLMIAALAEGGRIFDVPRYAEAAARAADFVLGTMRRADGGLYRTTRGGKTHLDAYLEDYAYLCDALVDVYEAVGRGRYLASAAELAERMVGDFQDEEAGGFFTTAHGHEKLLVRMREGQDGPTPSSNATAARALLRLAWHLGRDRWRALAEGAVRAHGQMIDRAPRAFCGTLSVVDMLLEGPVECVLAGADTAPLRAELARVYLPNRIIVHLHDADARALAPASLVAGKEKGPALYVCRDFVCERPITDPREIVAALEGDRHGALRARSTRFDRRIVGHATAEGTERYAARMRDRRGEAAYRELGRTGLWSSRLGFGGYRVDDQNPVFAEALSKALAEGVNLVDTSTNYADGGSERLVGRTLAQAFTKGDLARDEVIVVSKIGYVQGQNLEIAERRKREGKPFPEMVEYGEGIWHSIHPEWLADQLERSLDRLGLETLDVCLLHNPEYFLSHAHQHGAVTEEHRGAFYERMERAFAFFETQVKEGRIGCYGVSSNTVAHTGDPEATELARMLEAARRAGGDAHHFRVLQLPLNLLESEAALAPVAGDDTLLAVARKRGVGVLVNRPLNAIVGDGMLRLADVPAAAEGPPLGEALDPLRRLERRFGEILGGEALSGVPAGELFRWGDELASVESRITTLEQFDHVARGQILPHVAQALSLVERALPASARSAWTGWRSDYIRALEGALAALRAQVSKRAQKRVDEVKRALEPRIPAARLGASMSQQALWVLLGTEGVDVVLLGMRRPHYVAEALDVLAWAPPREVAVVYRAIKP